MKQEKTHVIDGKEYFATKIVTLKDKEYQEFKSVDYMNPGVQYAEIVNGEFELVKDWDTFYALSVKYAMCVLTLHGKLILDYTLNLDENEFIVQNGKLIILNEEKRAIFDRYVERKNL